MRASSLSTPRVLSALQQHYVSAWALWKDLRDLVDSPASSLSSLERQIIKTMVDLYRFPVDSYSFTPKGQLIQLIKANKISLKDDKDYYRFLQRSLRLARTKFKVPARGTTSRPSSRRSATKRRKQGAASRPSSRPASR